MKIKYEMCHMFINRCVICPWFCVIGVSFRGMTRDIIIAAFVGQGIMNIHRKFQRFSFKNGEDMIFASNVTILDHCAMLKKRNK